MKCPTCPDTALATSDRQGVEIDSCPQCRWVWLDRGELDKQIERSATVAPAPADDAPPRSWPGFVAAATLLAPHPGPIYLKVK
jgi:Zn-finger nucleic acid-binding protein